MKPGFIHLGKRYYFFIVRQPAPGCFCVEIYDRPDHYHEIWLYSQPELIAWLEHNGPASYNDFESFCVGYAKKGG